MPAPTPAKIHQRVVDLKRKLTDSGSLDTAERRKIAKQLKRAQRKHRKVKVEAPPAPESGSEPAAGGEAAEASE